MTDDSKSTQVVYSSDDICKMLDIKDSTLRKYAGLLVKHGYKFHTNDKGHRGYFDRDIAVLRRLIEIKESPDMTLERSVNAVMAWLDTTDMSDSVIEKNRHDKRYEELEKKVDRQNELLVELLKRMDQRDEKLMSAIRSIQEAKEEVKQLAAAEDKPKKGLLSRLFNK